MRKPQASGTMVTLAPHDRPREKLLRHGAGALGDNELVALVLGTGGRRGGALDIATTWSEADGSSVAGFLESVVAGRARPCGGHGSTRKLSHAVGALLFGAFRADGRTARSGTRRPAANPRACSG